VEADQKGHQILELVVCQAVAEGGHREGRLRPELGVLDDSPLREIDSGWAVV
jgi:hypothetical protein